MRKTQQQPKREASQAAFAADPAAVLGTGEAQMREPEERTIPSASVVMEEKKETGAIGRNSVSLPSSTGKTGGVGACFGN